MFFYLFMLCGPYLSVLKKSYIDYLFQYSNPWPVMAEDWHNLRMQPRKRRGNAFVFFLIFLLGLSILELEFRLFVAEQHCCSCWMLEAAYSRCMQRAIVCRSYTLPLSNHLKQNPPSCPIENHHHLFSLSLSTNCRWSNLV